MQKSVLGRILVGAKGGPGKQAGQRAPGGPTVLGRVLLASSSFWGLQAPWGMWPPVSVSFPTPHVGLSLCLCVSHVSPPFPYKDTHH